MNFEVLMPQLSMIVKIIIAAIFGGMIGYYRRGKRAGVRTISLIAIGSTLFTLISIHGFATEEARIASNIVTGIGFIGAGVIWKQEKAIEGITTAATIWVAAAVGMAVALDMWLIAFFSAIFIILILKSRIDAKK